MWTHEKVTASERDPAFRVPFLAVQKVASIPEDGFFDTGIKDDRVEGTFGARGDKTPVIPRIRSVNRNLLFSRLLPGCLGFFEDILDEPVIPAEDATWGVIQLANSSINFSSPEM